jgi:predicted ATPase
MKITNLKVTGFRSLKSIDWHPGDLNIIIGPNASGKSNFLDLFEMLSCLPRRGLADYVQSRGGISSLLWDGQAEGIGVVLDFEPSSDVNAENGSPLRYSLQLLPSGQLGSYQKSKESLVRQDSVLELIGSSKDSGHSTLVKAVEAYLQRQAESSLAYLDPLSGVSECDSLALWLAAWRVYQAIDISRQSKGREAPVVRYDTQVENDGSNLINVLHTLYTENRGFHERIDAAMGAAFDHFVELVFPPSPAADQRVQMKVRWKGLKRDCPLSDLSDGTLRFLYLISILANPNPPSLIAIDEPETGLHPKMMGIVAEYAMEAARRTQLILTTHSAEFLDAFNEEPPTVTVAELVDGETKLTVRSGDDLAYWLKEYTLGALFRSGELEHTE